MTTRDKKSIAVTVSYIEKSYTITVDDVPIRITKDVYLKIEHLGVAECLADEWREQVEGGVIKPNPARMLLTRLVSQGLLMSEDEKSTIATQLAEYYRFDALTVIAENQPDLAEQQQAAFQPVIAWFSGHPQVSPVEWLKNLDNLRFAIAEYLIRLYSSFMLGFAVLEGYIETLEAHRLSCLEEEYQNQRWGIDEQRQLEISSIKQDLSKLQKFIHNLE
jgi:chaperone required for assembly of F1-ATPase